MSAGYVPDAGDLIWLTFDPQAGREQAGRRPALVVSPMEYNAKVGLVILCPITNQSKKYPFEVALPDRKDITGVILADQIKSLDWKARNAARVCTLPDDVVAEVLEKIAPLLRPGK